MAWHMKKECTLRVWLLVSAVVCGGLTMAVELLGARTLCVGYGSSSIVWGAVISVTLVSLAVGYFAGGILADRIPKPKCLAAIILALSLVTAVCPFAQPVLRICYDTMGISRGILLSSTTIFFLPMALLGTVSPFVIRLLGEGETKAGRTAGTVYAVSTAGGAVGALLTGFWLIPGFGISACFRIVALTAAALGATGFILLAGPKGAVSILFPASLFLAPGISQRIGQEHTAPGGERIVLESVCDSRYGRIVVATRGQYRLLIVNGIVQTGMPVDLSHLLKGRSLLDCYYQELIPYMVNDPDSCNALVIGIAGGMTPSILMNHGMEVDCVELDPVILEVARRWFSFSGNAVVSDGRRFLERCKEVYDFCVIDAYSGDSLPFHLTSVEVFRTVKRVLKPGGVLVINLIAAPEGAPFASVSETLTRVFPQMLALRSEPGDDVQTITLFASEKPIEFSNGWLAHLGDFSGTDPVSQSIDRLTVRAIPKNGVVLRDNHNPIDTMRTAETVRWRRRTADSIGSALIF